MAHSYPLHRKRSMILTAGLICAVSFLTTVSTSSAADSKEISAKLYSELVLEDKPIAYWQFNSEELTNHESLKSADMFSAERHGSVQLNVAGPRPAENNMGYLNFTKENKALLIKSGGSYLSIDDPGEKSPLDYHQGDSITLEAWVDLSSLSNNSNVYILGKGRTNRSGFAANNQNYALRLRGMGESACVSFLFRDEDNKSGKEDSWHRWTSKQGFYPGTGWQHVAVSYKFGEPDSIKGYINGQLVTGTWDMGGKSKKAPIVDNDQLWIGSSLGGSPGNTFRGGIDEVAIYRSIVPAKNIKKRYQFKTIEQPKVTLADLPEDAVLVQLTEKIADSKSWKIPPLAVSETYQQPSFATFAVPNKYSNKGIISDRSRAFLLRASAAIELPAGEHEFLLRSLGGARLWIDNKLVATNRFLKPGGDAHGSVPDLPAAEIPGMRPLPAGHAETITTQTLESGTHLVSVEILVGGSKVRQETGEFGLFHRQGEELFTLVSPRSEYQISLTDENWIALENQERSRLRELNLVRRRTASTEENKYWAKRHAVAQDYVASLEPIEVPTVAKTDLIYNEIDHFVQAQLEKAEITPSALTDDDAFLRRIYLDTVGLVPTEDEQEEFLAQPVATRRAWQIDQLLKDPRAADHWTPYWQDVLAENPGILKPKLNNTGPFRWWIYESLLENKPIDRFATELIMMEGSLYYGGPAGFAMASQNDVPMAAKAHIIGQAFLAVEMKCARCHDAPFHDVTQEDLFSLAAMLKKSPQEIPKTSSVPLTEEESNSSIITVTLQPGTKVQPKWPFSEFILDSDLANISEAVRNPKDTRDQLAASITSPLNQRFSKVLVNRLWARYFGQGLVSSVDDWDSSFTSHPELLDYLARELVSNNYDLQHVSRLILNSQTYQRAADAQLAEKTLNEMPLFAAQKHRRLTAEQILDSLFVTAGKPFDSEQLTMDPLSTLDVSTFLNLGKPERAWQFTSLSNERDRPSLAIPRAQSLVDVLTSFGWRAMRQNPISERDHSPVVQQPAILANGSAARRIVGFSDDSVFTKIALESATPSETVTRIYRQTLARKPSAEELGYFTDLLSDGFNQRKTGKPPIKKEKLRFSVSWNNHLSKEANVMKIKLEEEVRKGDPSTPQLETTWREKAEDMVWALINSPEFVFTP